jgi:hypothetical protein
VPPLSYRRRGLMLARSRRARGPAATERQVRDLQTDLRCLGYLKNGIDGVFGAGTERAVKALQHDLLANDGRSSGNDGPAPVRMLDFNRGRVVAVTGEVDQALVECISDLLDDPAVPALPRADDPVEENRRIAGRIAALPRQDVPVPFLMAILRQESGLKHFNEPRGADEDRYIVVGLDCNATQKHIVTSRGYGAGQYTLFHHPPRPEEVTEFMADVGKNVQKAVRVLRDKLDHFVAGPTSGTRADDRIAEHGTEPLRLCKYDPADPRYLTDCRQCVRDARKQDIRPGVTRLHPGSGHTYIPTANYRTAAYQGVPVRMDLGCDWPYAVRRYNGAGIDSYHYQARVLLHLADL